MRYKGDPSKEEKGLSRYERGIILEKAYQSLAKRYDFQKLFGFAFSLVPRFAAKRAAKKAFICSELTAWCYKEAKIDLIPRTPEETEAPADIAKSKKLDWIGSWNESTKVDDAKLDVRHSIQGEHHCLAKKIIKWIKPRTQKVYTKVIQQKREEITKHLEKEKLEIEELEKKILEKQKSA